MLAQATVPGGALVMEFLAPHGYQVESDEDSWTFSANVPSGHVATPLVAVSLAFQSEANPATRTLSVETADDGWLVHGHDTQIHVPAKPRLLYEGAGLDLAIGDFLNPRRQD